MGSQEMDPNDSLIPAHEFPEYDETLQLLIERISQLPLTTRRILAMYYYETMPIREIAAWFGMPEYRIEETRIETVDLLRKYFLSLLTGTLQPRNNQERWLSSTATNSKCLTINTSRTENKRDD